MALKNQMWTTGAHQVDVAHAFATDATVRNQHTTFFTNTLMLYTAVFTAEAFPVPGRSENLFAEQTVFSPLWLR